MKPAQRAAGTASQLEWNGLRVEAPFLTTATVLVPIEAFQLL